MEGIIRRLLIVLTVAGVLSGAFMLWGGNNQVKGYQAYYDKTKAEYEGYDKCLTHKSELECQSDRMGAQDSEQVALELEGKAQGELDTGFAILALTVLLWPAFFLIRWILTGHVKRKAVPAPSDQQGSG